MKKIPLILSPLTLLTALRVSPQTLFAAEMEKTSPVEITQLPADPHNLYFRQIESNDPDIVRHQAMLMELGGDLRGAIEKLQKLLILYRASNPELIEQGNILYWLGGIYRKLGNYASALDYYQQAGTVFQQVNDRESLMLLQISYGELYADLGQNDLSLDYYEEAEVAYEKLDKSKRDIRDYRLNILHGISNIKSRLGKDEEALAASQSGLAFAREFNRRGLVSYEPDIIDFLNEIGILQLKAGQFSEAEQSFQEALKVAGSIFPGMPQNIYVRTLAEGRTTRNLGELAVRRGDSRAAVEFYTKALEIFRSLELRLEEADTLRRLGAMRLESEQLESAKENLLAAAEIWESTRSQLEDFDRIHLVETQAQTYQLLQQTFVALGDSDRALEISERGRTRALVELLAEKRGTGSVVPKAPTLEEIKRIARDRKATLVEYSLVGSPSTQRLYVWVISPTGAIAFREMDFAVAQSASRKNVKETTQSLQREATSIKELIRLTRDALGVGGRNANRTSSGTNANSAVNQRLRQLHRLLIEPISELLPADPNSPVIFIPDRELFFAPFPALIDAQGQYLIEKHTPLTSPSIQVLQFARERQRSREQNPVTTLTGDRALIVGNPTMPPLTVEPGLPPVVLSQLPAAEREANAIAKLLKTRALVGNAATETAVKDKLPAARLIHFATHGLLDYGFISRGLPGALILASSSRAGDEGLLAAMEIVEFDLNADLVVLSACDTGTGDITNDGAVGLARAFIGAGASSVIASLWSIPDAPTASLMEAFYRQWQATGNKAGALRQAMLTTMKTHPGSENWAAFTLMGE